MKATFFTITSAALFTLSLAAPAPQIANVVIATGDGDSSAGISVPVGKLVTSASIGGSATSGVKASVNGNFFCQAFSDAVGKTVLGGPFNITASTNFAACAGSTSCTLADAVPIGAYCCVTKEADLKSCVKGASPPPPTTSTPADNTAGKTVRVQLSGADELAIQLEVPLNGKPFLTGSLQKFQTVAVSDTEGFQGVKCQAFIDIAAKVKAGSIFSTDNVSLGGDQLVQAIACMAKKGSTGTSIPKQTKPVSSPTPTATPASAPVVAPVKSTASGKTVRVQISGADELAIQVEIPVDGKPFATGSIEKFQTIAVSDDNGLAGVECQAFSDVAAKVKVGVVFDEDTISLYGDELVQAIVCKA
jgi:hypothetical protein